MRRYLLIVAVICLGMSFLGGWVYVLAGCGDRWQPDGPDTFGGTCGNAGQLTTLTQTKHWRIFWTNGYERRDAQVTEEGQCKAGWIFDTRCYPTFNEPHWVTFPSNPNETWFVQGARRSNYNDAEDNGTCALEDLVRFHSHKHNCAACLSASTFTGSCPSGYYPNYCGGCCSQAAQNDCISQGGYFNPADGYCRSSYDMCFEQQYECTGWDSWNSFACGCAGPCAPSPILVDVAGDGFRLTDSAGGVSFDINGDGAPDRISWTAAGTDDAWLVLDRDGDGVIGKGAEMFGNFTYQPHAPAGGERHGFLGLAEFDLPASSDNGNLGGNGDGVIDGQDAVFASLRLWRDTNHNGVSEPGELHTLPALDVERLHFDYKESKRADEFGNRFRYRAKVDDAKGAKVNRWAWDVFLVLGQ